MFSFFFLFFVSWATFLGEKTEQLGEGLFFSSLLLFSARGEIPEGLADLKGDAKNI